MKKILILGLLLGLIACGKSEEIEKSSEENRIEESALSQEMLGCFYTVYDGKGIPTVMISETCGNKFDNSLLVDQQQRIQGEELAMYRQKHHSKED
ncbi:MAG: hypothetical protein WCL30_02685 [Pseudomonadota bacterium]